MIPLKNKPNVNAPNSTWPFGELRNNPGDGSGTKVNEVMLGDQSQFFETMMVEGSVTPNGQLDNGANGFQLGTAFVNWVTAIINSIIASTTVLGISRFATQTEVNTGTANDIGITPLALATVGATGAWQSVTLNGTNVTVGAGTGTISSVSGTLKYKVIGKSFIGNIDVLFTTSLGSAISKIYIAVPVTWAAYDSRDLAIGKVLLLYAKKPSGGARIEYTLNDGTNFNDNLAQGIDGSIVGQIA